VPPYTVILRGFNSNCGEASDTVTINIADGLNAVEAFSPKLTICQGEEIDLFSDGDGFISSSWDSDGEGVFDNRTLANSVYTPGFNETGEIHFYLEGKDACNRATTDTLMVDIIPLTLITTNGDQTIERGDSVQLIAEGGNTYEWFPFLGLSNSNTDNLIDTLMAAPIETITYTVTDSTAATGCLIPAELTVTVEEPTGGRVHFPNAFSPNNDAQNDEFKPIAYGVAEFNMKVWNRYGELVFETNDYTMGWNGEFNGYKQEVGVYVWYAEYTYDYEPDKIVNAYGNVTLVR